MPRIFVSFRKADERLARDRVYRALAGRFGADQVFKSGAAIPPGADFAEILLRQAAQCEVMLVLIGPGWLSASDGTGQRLLDRDHDWVRREIAISFRSGNRVIPVLLGDATMLPSEADLPSDIARLGRLQFLRIEESRVEAGLSHLIKALTALLPGLEEAAGPGAAPNSQPAAAPSSVRQTATASGGSVVLNVGGNLNASGARIVGGDDGSRSNGKR